MFQFKQFEINDDKCAMKVGTDGVLLGAWADIDPTKHLKILDIGTGTGLIALMMAQKTSTDTQILAIDIDGLAAEQAAFNAKQSRWKKNIEVKHISLQEFTKIYSTNLFDLIVSNPPYFEINPQSKTRQRQTARQMLELNFEDLLACVAQLIAPKGSFNVIVPYEHFFDSKLKFIDNHGFQITRLCRVFSTPEKQNPIRLLLTLGLNSDTPNPKTSEETLVIHQKDRIYTEQYKALTRDFYTIF